MDSLKPAEIVANMVQTGIAKSELGPFDLLIRGALSGALARLRHQPGDRRHGADRPAHRRRAHLPGRLRDDRAARTGTGHRQLRAACPWRCCAAPRSLGTVLANWTWVFVGNLLGSVFYAALLAIALTMPARSSQPASPPPSSNRRGLKTIGYAHFGTAGMLTVFVKAILCNWMVCLGVVMAMSSTSTIGRIAGAWMPILMFFAQGFEHSVVNMFVIPAGMMMGAKVTHRGLVAVEPDPGHARQHRRRPGVHRPRALRHLRPPDDRPSPRRRCRRGAADRDDDRRAVLARSNRSI